MGLMVRGPKGLRSWRIPAPTSAWTTSSAQASDFSTWSSPEHRPFRFTTPEDSEPLSSVISVEQNVGSTGKGILIGILSAFSSAAFVAIIFAIVYFFRYTSRGRIFLDRIGRPGEYDDEQAFAREEAEALEGMDDLQRAEYQRAKAFVIANPPESMPTDISLSQFLAIQEKGVSAWEFEPELEIANCFVEGRTEIEFFDSECSVQSNLPVPKQNEVYYWEAKIYDKPDATTMSIGMTTKPYPLFRLPGFHRYSVAYTSTGHRRHNQPFTPAPYGPQYMQGDVVGVGYRPRTGTVFFTRNGKKLEDVVHGLRSQNLFPTVGANGPCTVHVNFGQMGFVFIEANVKKWGLAPMTGSMAPPPPYGSEQGSILLEAGREGAQNSPRGVAGAMHSRTRSGQVRNGPPASPGPVRSPTEISLAQLVSYTSNEDAGEGRSDAVGEQGLGVYTADLQDGQVPPPEYSSPRGSKASSADGSPEGERIPARRAQSPRPPIPSYEAATNSHRDEQGSNGQHG